MNRALVVVCAIIVGAMALPTPILEPRFQSGAPVVAPTLDKKAQAALAQDRATKLTTEANKLPAASRKRVHLLKKAEKAQMDFEQYTAEAATDDLVPKPQVVGFGADRLPDAQVPGEVPKTLLTNREVDIVARNVLAAARKNVCNKKGEYCDLKLTGEFKKGPSGDSNNMAKWKAEFLAKQKGKGKGKGKGKAKGKKGKGKKGKKAKAKAKAKKDAKKAKKDAKKAKKDAKKSKALAKKGAVKAAAEMKKAAKLRKKASKDLKKAAKANKKGDKKKAKKLEKKAKKKEKKAKKQEKKAKKDANKIPKTKEACAKQKGKWDAKTKKCALKKK